MLDRLGQQDGFIRESVKVFVIVMIVFVVMLDAHSLFDNRREAGNDAHEAALAAAAVYSKTHNDALAKQEAQRALDANDSRLVAFKVEHLDADTYYTVIASHAATTYFFHYLGNFPWVGTWAEEFMHPNVSSNNYTY